MNFNNSEIRPDNMKHELLIGGYEVISIQKTLTESRTSFRIKSTENSIKNASSTIIVGFFIE
jgi:hypothetical protein